MRLAKVRTWFAVLLTSLTVAVAVGIAPPATAAVTPIGNLGETLRVEFDDFVADVTVHDVLAVPVPPGWGWNGSPRWRAQGGPWRAGVTVHVISAPNPYKLSIATTFSGVTPYADAYGAKQWREQSDGDEIASGGVALPTTHSISFRLIEDWYDAGAKTPLRAEPGVRMWRSPRSG